MVGRLSKILKELNIGIQTARSILGRNITLNSKITHGTTRSSASSTYWVRKVFVVFWCAIH